MADKNNAKETLDKIKTDANYDIALEGAQMGEVVTRFPPEPSGYLHIGHAKAALLNEYFARAYEGKLIIRFDDTNPSKEKAEFEEAIIEDLKLLGIKGDRTTWTSDHFDKLYELMVEMIKLGKAYVDDTPQETMKVERMNGVASKNRDAPVERNLELFEEMKKGTEIGLTCCVRGKISVDNVNKALRDPVFYRCNVDVPHNRTGTKWRVYPTYDFACPIVDSIEGVTHALRTNEYRDRNPQYEWVVKTLKLREPFIWDYSRMCFVYTLLSKRKLQWFVDKNYVSGWDDPRFPTVRGIRRRGMTIDALREYILMQGPSRNTILLEWDKLWTMNKKVIDPISPRHVALEGEIVKVNLSNGPSIEESKMMPKHKKNPDVGEKKTIFAKTILLEAADAQDLVADEEVTMMDWGNCIIRKVHRAEGSNTVSSIDADLHLEGDFKKTKKKLTWLADTSDIVPVNLHDYDYLITEKKVEEDVTVADILNPKTEYSTKGVADGNIRQLKRGDIIQFERKGYYICDNDAEGAYKFIAIPDGRVASISLKGEAAKIAADKEAAAAAEQAAKKAAKKAAAEERKKQKAAQSDVAGQI